MTPKEICIDWVRHQRPEVSDQAEIERLAYQFFDSAPDGGLSHVVAAERELRISAGEPIVRWHSWPGVLPPLTIAERDTLKPAWSDMVNIDNRELQTWDGSAWVTVERRAAAAALTI
jgi:hypothetical protein